MVDFEGYLLYPNTLGKRMTKINRLFKAGLIISGNWFSSKEVSVKHFYKLKSTGD
jgi:hypothetical protein